MARERTTQYPFQLRFHIVTTTGRTDGRMQDVPLNWHWKYVVNWRIRWARKCSADHHSHVALKSTDHSFFWHTPCISFMLLMRCSICSHVIRNPWNGTCQLGAIIMWHMQMDYYYSPQKRISNVLTHKMSLQSQSLFGYILQSPKCAICVLGIHFLVNHFVTAIKRNPPRHNLHVIFPGLAIILAGTLVLIFLLHDTCLLFPTWGE